eukprot:2503475-Lingulodinium_polyedra.AAC.1
MDCTFLTEEEWVVAWQAMFLEAAMLPDVKPQLKPQEHWDAYESTQKKKHVFLRVEQIQQNIEDHMALI